MQISVGKISPIIIVEQAIKKTDTSIFSILVIILIASAAVNKRMAAGTTETHAIGATSNPSLRVVALAWVQRLVMMSLIQRLVTKAVSMINLATRGMICSLKNTPAALRMLAKEWKGHLLALIVVELARITMRLALSCGTLPLVITHVKRSLVVKDFTAKI